MMPRGKNGYSWELNSGTQDSEPLLERDTEDPDDVLFTSRPGTSTFVADMLSSHSHKMNNQHNQLDLISNSVKTLKNVSEDISVELDHQNVMLENLSSELDKTESRLDMVSKKVAQVLQLSDDKRQWMAIGILVGIILITIILLIIL
ncbi:syntaxin-10 isoform X1 [Metopolophium dirhodum]|uniref:syntaxin-10 isoform X1 n=1 Tax=Metopolophium dirhodum TaxID=44670 RepID=UPI00298FEDD9|nr:syntaxin-10 isoform X1 [Metopolophium dirhodum]XP_060878984.1 syntaxin-10 isoform X1 [Metopolophium dirhodum]